MNRTNLRFNFVHRHVGDIIVILGEGNRPYPRCPHCDMFVSLKDLNGRHLTTALCRWGVDRKRDRLSEEEAQAGAKADFIAYGTPLALLTSFRYLERVLLADEDNCPAVVCNLCK